jgi:hypothetical protein
MTVVAFRGCAGDHVIATRPNGFSLFIPRRKNKWHEIAILAFRESVQSHLTSKISLSQFKYSLQSARFFRVQPANR